MKRTRFALIVVVALLAIPAATLYAQSTGTRFVVPFQFTAGDKVMPAGDYFVECPLVGCRRLPSQQGELRLLIMTHRSQRTQETKTRLIFHVMATFTSWLSRSCPTATTRAPSRVRTSATLSRSEDKSPKLSPRLLRFPESSRCTLTVSA